MGVFCPLFLEYAVRENAGEAHTKAKARYVKKNLPENTVLQCMVVVLVFIVSPCGCVDGLPFGSASCQ